MENLRDLDITRDELDRIGQALKHKEFRDLLVEYCEELNDPATKKQYEEEITQLEKERGVEVTFVHPTSAYVIKTSSDGNKLAFINVCSNDHVDEPSSKNAAQDGSRGRQWSLPHLLSPPKEDMSKKGSRCTVYDVIFHPKTLQLASHSTQFRDMVNKISCEAVESNFNVVLDKTNLKFPKLKYKGVSRPVVIRKKTGKPANDIEADTGADKLYSDLYKQLDEHYDSGKFKSTQKCKTQQVKQKSDFTTPKYIIKHRSDLDIQDFTYDPASKMNAATPKELIVEIDLPLLKSSADLDLDVTEKSLKISSDKPSKYKLYLTLPYAINEDAGNAKFDTDQRKLIVTLPVKRNCNLLISDIGRYDSGVDSDSCPVADNSPTSKSLPLIEELQAEDSAFDSQCSSVHSESDVFRTSEKSNSFLIPDLHYTLPEYSCHLFDNILSFTLNVKNVDSDSIKKEYNESFNSIHIKFSSISSGYFPVNYAFYVNLPLHSIETENVSIEAWDNNVIVQIPYNLCDTALCTYYVGTCQDTSEEKLIQEPSIINKNQLEAMTDTNELNSKPNIQVHLNSEDELTIVVSQDKHKDDDSETSSTNSSQETDRNVVSNAQNIFKSRSFSESSMDEFSTSQSPSKGKSILKTGRLRCPVSRSMSESSVDDFTWSSFENCAANSESLIPEEEETSSSMKKTVRFNDVVSRQLFRSNSSILGQRKKNQRKSRNKKKAQERRVSESENSEPEDKKEKEKSNYLKEKSEDEKCAKQIDFKSDMIFALDM